MSSCGFGPPDVVEQLGLLHQLCRVAHQRLQQGEPFAREGISSLQGDQAAAVQGQAALGKWRHSPLVTPARWRSSTRIRAIISPTPNGLLM